MCYVRLMIRRKAKIHRKEENVRVPLTRAQKDVIRKAADAEGLATAAWMRRVAVREATRLAVRRG